jgi:putative FmdB family regulatory protein
MPLYEYQCHGCGKKFEVIQKFSDEPLTTHPECGSGPVEKLVSAPAFHLKGTGWYATDYAKSGSTTAKKDEAKASDSSAGSEAKPAASETKTETKESAPAPAVTTPTP